MIKDHQEEIDKNSQFNNYFLKIDNLSLIEDDNKLRISNKYPQRIEERHETGQNLIIKKQIK